MRLNLHSTRAGRIILYGLISTSLRMSVGATSVIYLMAHSVTLAQIGAMKAMQATLILLLDVPLSMLADRRGRGIVLMGGNLAAGLWLGVTAWSTTVPGFFVAEALNAVGLAAFNGVFSALLVQTYEKETGCRDFENILGWFGKWQFLLMAIAAAGGAWLYDGQSAQVWWVAAVGMIGLVLATPFLIEVSIKKTPSGARLQHTADNGGPVVGGPFEEGDETDSSGAQAPRRWPILHILGSAPSLGALAAALVGISLAFQVLLQFWQPVIDSKLASDDHAGMWFGAAFVVFLLAQSVAAHCVRRYANVTHGRCARLMFVVGLSAVIVLFPQLPLAATIAAVAAGFFIVKGLSIVVLADVQRIVPDKYWSTTESTIASVSRVLFIATMPLIGAFGDTTDVESILVVVFVLMVGSFLAMANSRPPRTG